MVPSTSPGHQSKQAGKGSKSAIRSLLLQGDVPQRPSADLTQLVELVDRYPDERREERVALSADIESMLSQVVVPAEDQTVLRFLWREHQSSAPDVYQYCRHIFGAKSSPTSVNYVFRQTAEDNRREFPKAAETVLLNFYMADLFTSEESEDMALETHVNLTKLLLRGGFRLTKWCSSSREVLTRIPH